MAIHAAMVDRMDVEIGRVIDQLKRMGAFENTIICFASDKDELARALIRAVAPEKLKNPVPPEES